MSERVSDQIDDALELAENWPHRLEGEWHKLHPDHYEAAVAEGIGAWVGAHYGRGTVPPRHTKVLNVAMREAIEVAFCWGYTAGRTDGEVQP